MAHLSPPPLDPDELLELEPPELDPPELDPPELDPPELEPLDAPPSPLDVPPPLFDDEEHAMTSATATNDPAPIPIRRSSFIKFSSKPFLRPARGPRSRHEGGRSARPYA
jgi:hypothetical protein